MAVIEPLETSSRLLRSASSASMYLGGSRRPKSSYVAPTIVSEDAPERPPPPIVGKVNHHSIELYWEESLDAANELAAKGDGRVRVGVQEEDKHGSWGNVYTGYAKKHIIDGLEAWSQYRYRIRFQNSMGYSEWSPAITVSTTKEPLTGEHLHRAIALQDIGALERVLESGHLRLSAAIAPVDVLVDTPDKYGFSPLMAVAQKGYVEFIEVLVKYGADVNFQNDAGKTSLMLAAYAGQTAAVKELRHFGAKYELQDKGGSTALHWAMDGGNQELIDWMVENGADLGCVDFNGWTPLLRIAAVTGKADVARLVLRLGADANIKDRDGKTALMIAVVNGHQGLVELLLEMKADITIKNEYGKNAYEMALSMERRRLIRTLEEHMDKKGIKYF